MTSVMFTVPGKPQGKARARTYYNVSTKKHCSTTPENTVLYENFIKDRYLQMAKGAFLEREKPVTLRIIARYLPPKSVSKKRKLDMLEGRELPLKKPDMDNIVKVVADALNGVAYHDDTQIALVQAKKCYSAVEGLDVTVEEYRDANSKGTMILLKVKLFEYHDKYMELGSIPPYAFENFCDMYESYHELGGNGTGTKMYEEIKDLHLNKKK